MKLGRLIIVSSGIGPGGQCTTEGANAIVGADIVFSLMGDHLAQQWLETLSGNVSALEPLYESSPDRPTAYARMVDMMLEAVRKGDRVCGVFYGHAGVFVTPSHVAIARARAEGFPALMLAGVSAEDCLYTDLGFDPGASGCASYEAHDFFMTKRVIDPHAALILWQLAVFGDQTFTRLIPDSKAIAALAQVLMQTYPPDHVVTVYAAAVLPALAASLQRVALCDLASAEITQESTLFVPPLGRARVAPERVRLLAPV